MSLDMLVCSHNVPSMASVFKRAGSKFWYAAYRVPTTDSEGRRRWKLERIVTKHTDQKKARKAADLLEEEGLRAAGAGDDGSKRILAILREAVDLAVQKRLTIELGREFLRKIVEEATGEILKVWTIREWLYEWLEQKRSTSKTATITRYKHSIEAFVEFLGEKAEWNLDHLTVKQLRTFRDKLHGEGRTAKTCNGYTKDLKAALSGAVEEGLLKKLPAGTLKDLPEDDSLERETFTIEEISKLVVACPNEEWRGVVLLGAFGGLRLGDATRLQHSSLDFKEGVINYLPQKSSRRKKKARIILPMHRDVRSFFQKQQSDKKGDCFPSLAQVSIGGNGGLSTQFVKIMAAAKVGRGQSKAPAEGKAGRRNHGRSFHSLRHTFNSMMLNKGVAQEIRMKIVGHADAETNAGYSHAELQSLRAAVDLVPGMGK